MLENYDYSSSHNFLSAAFWKWAQAFFSFFIDSDSSYWNRVMKYYSFISINKTKKV